LTDLHHQIAIAHGGVQKYLKTVHAPPVEWFIGALNLWCNLDDTIANGSSCTAGPYVSLKPHDILCNAAAPIVTNITLIPR
jgi:hypothetical protein